MGAPVGNKNNENGKRFQLALAAALEKRGTDKVQALHAVADKLIETALEGNIHAIREVADRLDGKPAQAVNLGDHEGNALTINLVQYSDK